MDLEFRDKLGANEITFQFRLWTSRSGTRGAPRRQRAVRRARTSFSTACPRGLARKVRLSGVAPRRRDEQRFGVAWRRASRRRAIRRGRNGLDPRSWRHSSSTGKPHQAALPRPRSRMRRGSSGSPSSCTTATSASPRHARCPCRRPTIRARRGAARPNTWLVQNIVRRDPPRKRDHHCANAAVAIAPASFFATQTTCHTPVADIIVDVRPGGDVAGV